MSMPRQWILTTLYIIFVYLVIHGLIIYARNHPLEDVRSSAQPVAAGHDKALDTAPQHQ